MFAHPLWLVGFRPFFTLALASAVLLPALWPLIFTGAVALPEGGPAPTAWHAHEMLFGFGWAVLGGFLLTASKNWVGTRGMHGGPLALAALLWLAERGAILLPAVGWTAPLRLVLLNAFGAYVFGYVVFTLVRHRARDSFSDNGFFVVALPVFLVAKNLVLFPETFKVGVSMSVGLYRVAFAVMFERTITQFMKNAMNAELPRYRALDMGIKSLVLLAAFEALLPPSVAAAAVGLAAALLFGRLLTWKPLVALRSFGIGIMYAGYAGLVAHLALDALRLTGVHIGVGSLAVHAFTFLCMGLVIPSMLIRISQGHTGRKVVFTRSDRLGLLAMAAGAFFRLVATQLWPSSYVTWIALSAAGWCACFVLIGLRIAPLLFEARVDGRVH